MRPTADHQSLVNKFEKVMVKLATLGQNPGRLTDCSEVIPVAANTKLPPATLPAGKTLKEIEASVRAHFCVFGPYHALTNAIV